MDLAIERQRVAVLVDRDAHAELGAVPTAGDQGRWPAGGDLLIETLDLEVELLLAVPVGRRRELARQPRDLAEHDLELAFEDEVPGEELAGQRLELLGVILRVDRVEVHTP